MKKPEQLTDEERMLIALSAGLPREFHYDETRGRLTVTIKVPFAIVQHRDGGPYTIAYRETDLQKS